MPDIAVGSQVFDLAFHPDRPLVLAGLLTGNIKAFSYDEQGNYEEKFSVRPSKRSCRTLAVSEDGTQVWAGGKAKAIQCVSSLSMFSRSVFSRSVRPSARSTSGLGRSWRPVRGRMSEP